jgi:hypothetical protein
MSTLCSAAILRTTGDDRVCRSSSGVISARGLSAGAGAALVGVGGVLARLDANDDAVDAAGAENAAGEAGVEGAGAAAAGGAAGAGTDAAEGAAAAGAGGAGVDVTAGVEVPGLAADVPSACATATDWLVGWGELGGGAAALAASPSPMTPTTVLMGTVAPGSTRISLSTPEAGAGISASTLSVEISKSGSSRCTRSPTFFIHLVIVPSAIDSPIWGMMTSVI